MMANRAREIINASYMGVEAYAFENRAACREFITWLIDAYKLYWLPVFEWESINEPAKFYGVRLTFCIVEPKSNGGGPIPYYDRAEPGADKSYTFIVGPK